MSAETGKKVETLVVAVPKNEEERAAMQRTLVDVQRYLEKLKFSQPNMAVLRPRGDANLLSDH